jgi:membrane-associated HD superfamily phosphohydrolase
MTQGRIKSLEDLGFVWSLHEIWAQQEPHLEKTMQLAAKKKLAESHATSKIISNAAAAIAASNPIVSDAATSAAVAAAAAVIHSNSVDDEEETKEFSESVVSDGALLDDVVAFV